MAVSVPNGMPRGRPGPVTFKRSAVPGSGSMSRGFLGTARPSSCLSTQREQSLQPIFKRHIPASLEHLEIFLADLHPELDIVLRWVTDSFAPYGSTEVALKN